MHWKKGNADIMTKFDKKIKKLARDIEVPESYDKRVDETLRSIGRTEETPRKRSTGKWVLRIAICLACVIGLFSWQASRAEANIFDFFKQTIMDFLNIGTEEDAKELGVESDKTYVKGRRDLFLEMQEVVIDSHSIYAMVRVTAPSDIELSEDILFDYFCFCKGDNYNVNETLGGSRDCKLLEVGEENPNVGTYVISITFSEELEEGETLSVCCKDLTRNPYSDAPELLVEGIWSIPFPFEPTVSEHIEIKGTDDMVFSFINTTATVEKIELMPSCFILVSDVSNFPQEDLGISDTRIEIRLEMLDGSELILVSRKEDERGYTQGGEKFFYEEGGRSYQQDTLELAGMININTVSGIYIEDLYIPVK